MLVLRAPKYRLILLSCMICAALPACRSGKKSTAIGTDTSKKPAQKPTDTSDETPRTTTEIDGIETPSAEETSKNIPIIQKVLAEYTARDRAHVSWTMSAPFTGSARYIVYGTKNQEINTSKDMKLGEVVQGTSVDIHLPPQFQFSLKEIDATFVYVQFKIDDPSSGSGPENVKDTSDLTFIHVTDAQSLGLPKPSPSFKPKIDLNCHPGYPKASTSPEPCDKLATRFVKANPYKNDQTFYVRKWNTDQPIIFHLHQSLPKKDIPYIKPVFDHINTVAKSIGLTQNKLIDLADQIVTGDVSQRIDVHTIKDISPEHSKAANQMDVFPPSQSPISGSFYKGELLDADIEINRAGLFEIALGVGNFTLETYSKIEHDRIFIGLYQNTLAYSLLSSLGLSHNYKGMAYKSIMVDYPRSDDHLALAMNHQLNTAPGQDYDLQVLKYLYTNYFHEDQKRFEDLNFEVLRAEP